MTVSFGDKRLLPRFWRQMAVDGEPQCPRGHDYIDPFGPNRRCRECHREVNRRYRARQKERHA